MAYRKNVKRIDPRYFLHETVDRNDDGSPLEEQRGIPDKEAIAAGLGDLDLSKPDDVMARIAEMVDGGNVTPENGGRLVGALQLFLKRNAPPALAKELKGLIAQVRKAAGISDWRSAAREAGHSAGAAAHAAALDRGEAPTGMPEPRWAEE